jgi:formate dehydrogenase alpha subunit
MKVFIDGKEFEAKGGMTILEVARENGIYIPSLCDHPRLSPFTGCRLCLVEVKGRKGYVPSCGTYIENGMEVKTDAPELQKLRREIAELILSEHPNACLICSEKKNCDEYKSTIRKVGETTGCVLCPNNGRCDLQDVVEALKIDKIRFPSLYRNIEIKRGDPFFDRNYNLCILCGRCVRVCHELRGASAIAFVFRGPQTVVGTVLDKPLLESGCQFCGACVDVCPTGSLTERAVRYEGVPDARAKTICPLCSVGCELEVELKGGRLLSSRPAENGAVNKGQACVKGRFLIRDLVDSSRRALKPLIRKNEELEEANWEEALDFVASHLKKYKGEEIALVSSPQLSCEENYLFHKFTRDVLKSGNIDSALRLSPLAVFGEKAQRAGLEPDFNFKVDDIGQAKAILLAGADLALSHPIVWLEVLKAAQEGARLVVISPFELSSNRFSSIWLRIKPGAELFVLGFLSKILLEGQKDESLPKVQGFASFQKSLEMLDLTRIFEMTGIKEQELRRAASLLGAKPLVFLFGPGLNQHPWTSQNLASLWNLSLQTKASLFPLASENNLRGTFEIGKNFSRDGLNFNQIIQAASSGRLKALYLAGPFPELRNASLDFLVIQDSYRNSNLEKADAVLPAATFAENEGTFVNLEGRIQKFEKVIEPFGEAKPDWWIISQLAMRMGNKNFQYKNPAAILKEMSEAMPGFAAVFSQKAGKNEEIFVQGKNKSEASFLPIEFSASNDSTNKEYPFLLVLDYSLDYYRSLALSEESKGLKTIRNPRWLKVCAQDALDLGLKEGESLTLESPSAKIKGIARITESVPRGIVAATFLWNEDSRFSPSSLLMGLGSGLDSLSPLPVRIRRGD